MRTSSRRQALPPDKFGDAAAEEDIADALTSSGSDDEQQQHQPRIVTVDDSDVDDDDDNGENSATTSLRPESDSECDGTTTARGGVESSCCSLSVWERQSSVSPIERERE